jgi:hypothetical protein
MSSTSATGTAGAHLAAQANLLRSVMDTAATRTTELLAVLPAVAPVAAPVPPPGRLDTYA